MNARDFLLGGVSAIALGAAMVAAPVANAQTAVQQSGAKLDAATFFAQSAGGRTTCSTSQEQPTCLSSSSESQTIPKLRRGSPGSNSRQWAIMLL